MSNLKDLPKDLPPTEHEFEIDVQGSTTGKQYSGKFKCKIMRLNEQTEVSKHKALLSTGLNLDLAASNFIHMISYLRYSLISPNRQKNTEAGYPEWWAQADYGYELYDINVVETVYEKVLDFEKSYLEAVWGKKEEKEESVG